MSGDSTAPAWAVREIRIHGQLSRWCVHDDDRLIGVIDNEADARQIVEAVNGQAGLVRERDELRAEVERLRAAAAVEHHGDPAPQVAPSTLAALAQEVGGLGATMRGLSEQVAAFAALAAQPDDEIAKLRALALAVSLWLDEPVHVHGHQMREKAVRFIRAAAGCKPEVPTSVALRALAGGGR